MKRELGDRRAESLEGRGVRGRLARFLGALVDGGVGHGARLRAAPRMGERLDYAIDFPTELLAQPVPPTMLITLVESAIKHGLEPKPEDGRIALKARVERGRLRLTVAATGRGVSDLAGQGRGLSGIRERLALRYGKGAVLELDERENRGFAAHLLLPLTAGALPAVERGELSLKMAA